ncbi:MAG: arylesterase [Rhodobacteraceae bacterium]|nr:arylesterase [Paracoccaceae bacterium]
MKPLSALARSVRYGAVDGLRKIAFAVLLVAAPASAETLTIAALGDSLTQGYGVPRGEGFVPQLQRWVDARTPGLEVTVENAGVSGDTTAGGLARVGWTLTPEVDALIVTLGGNDLLRGIAPEASRANLAGILDAADKAGVPALLIGIPAPGNYGADYKKAFDAIYPELAAEYGALHHSDFLGAIRTEIAEGAETQTYLQPDNIHPNPAGVALIVEDIGPSVLDLIDLSRD